MENRKLCKKCGTRKRAESATLIHAVEYLDDFDLKTGECIPGDVDPITIKNPVLCEQCIDDMQAWAET